MWKEEGKGVSIFLKLFFSIVEWLGRGGHGSFSFDMLKGDGKGGCINVFLQIHYWGGGGV
jgi:hypothetical protein